MFDNIFDPLPEEKTAYLRGRRRALKRVINSYTIWEMVDPPLKSEEEIEKMKEGWKVELEEIDKILKENTKRKSSQTRMKNKRKRMQDVEFFLNLKKTQRNK